MIIFLQLIQRLDVPYQGLETQEGTAAGGEGVGEKQQLSSGSFIGAQALTSLSSP